MRKAEEKIFNEEDITIPVMMKAIRAEVHDPEGYTDCEICPMVSGYGCMEKLLNALRKTIKLPSSRDEYVLDICSGSIEVEDCTSRCYLYDRYGAPECRNQLLRICRRELKRMVKESEPTT